MGGSFSVYMNIYMDTLNLDTTFYRMYVILLLYQQSELSQQHQQLGCMREQKYK